MKEDFINWLIKKWKVDTNKITDGYHTFEQLYDHRITLYSVLTYLFNNDEYTDHHCWKSKVHSDGSVFEGWFIAGIGETVGEQITYHIPITRWDDFKIPELEKAPEWDSHTPEEILIRLKKIME